MPVHDWSRVADRIFHNFHLCWIAKLWQALNAEVLTRDHYAMIERVTRPDQPDLLTSPVDDLEPQPFTRRQRSVVIRHDGDQRIVALIEILSAGNKSSDEELRAFVIKAADFLDRGIHLLLIDLHPRTNGDTEGIHPLIWEEVDGAPQEMPHGRPLTLVAYEAGPRTVAYAEPVAVGDTLIEMPLFLAPNRYASVPLEATYQAAFRGVPRRFREALEAPTAAR